ncbi:MAG: hypothetical protein M3O30_07235 [Planctomycetota bacterium]|nr:hypothetical protein [Planctomycetota bacterium]
MIPVDTAISRFRRDMTLAALLRFALLIAAAACIILGPVLGARSDGMLLLLFIGGIWIMLSYRSVKGTRIVAGSPLLIAAGDYDQAEDRIDVALRTFSLFRTVKLISLHHLALLRHTQRRWRESALLCQALLSQKLNNLQGLSRTTLLLMTDSLLQMNDLRGAYDALSALNHHRLTLNEALTLQFLQLDYGSRIGAWELMVANVGAKARLAELMPAINAARSHALLALAAHKTGRAALGEWLARRALLLADVKDIVVDRPILADIVKAGNGQNVTNG